MCTGERRRAGRTGPQSGLPRRGDVRRRGAEHPDDGRSLDEKRQCLHRAPGDVRPRGQNGCRFQSAHDLLREYNMYGGDERGFARGSTCACVFA